MDMTSGCEDASYAILLYVSFSFCTWVPRPQDLQWNKPEFNNYAIM